MKIELTKKNKLILLIAIILFVMTPMEFAAWYSILEQLIESAMSFVLFIIYFVSVIAAIRFSLQLRYDVAQTSSFISIVFILAALIQTLDDHYIFGNIVTLFSRIQLGYVYVILMILMHLIIRFEKK